MRPLIPLICVLAVPGLAPAQVELDRPGRGFELVMTEYQVAGEPLRAWLGDLESQACLNGDRDEVVDALEALRRVHMDALHDRSTPAVWRMWNPRLRGCSDDGRRLVETWLDSPERARREYLCEDGLPDEWKTLAEDDYVLEALLWYEEEITDRADEMTGDVERVRESAVMQLMEAQDGVLDRYDATFPAGGVDEAARAVLEERMVAMWDELVEPHDLGFRPPSSSREIPAGAPPLRGPPIRPQGGGTASIPDPKDVAKLIRITSSWRHRQDLLDGDLDAQRWALVDLRRAIESAEDPEQLAALLREARRADAALECTLADLARFEDDVRTYDPGNRFMGRLLDQGHRENRVYSLDRSQAEVDEVREELALVIAELPDPGSTGGSGDGDGDAEGGGSEGPGRWIAGLPGAVERIAALEAGSVSEAETETETETEGLGGAEAGGERRWVERRFEGPLPIPSTAWDPSLVATLRDHQSALDDLDVAILLELIAIAFEELPDRASVEEAVWRSLEIPGGLELFGQESQLSELLDQRAAAGEQPQIVFVLRLWI